jgi:Na+/alanine symporter
LHGGKAFYWLRSALSYRKTGTKTAGGQYNVVNPAGGFLVENVPGVAIGPEYTQLAVNTHFPWLGGSFVAVALFLFAFTTILAYYYIAGNNLRYLNTRGIINGCAAYCGFSSY